MKAIWDATTYVAGVVSVVKNKFVQAARQLHYEDLINKALIAKDYKKVHERFNETIAAFTDDPAYQEETRKKQRELYYIDGKSYLRAIEHNSTLDAPATLKGYRQTVEGIKADMGLVHQACDEYFRIKKYCQQHHKTLYKLLQDQEEFSKLSATKRAKNTGKYRHVILTYQELENGVAIPQDFMSIPQLFARIYIEAYARHTASKDLQPFIESHLAKESAAQQKAISNEKPVITESLVVAETLAISSESANDNHAEEDKKAHDISPPPVKRKSSPSALSGETPKSTPVPKGKTTTRAKKQKPINTEEQKKTAERIERAVKEAAEKKAADEKARNQQMEHNDVASVPETKNDAAQKNKMMDAEEEAMRLFEVARQQYVKRIESSSAETENNNGAQRKTRSHSQTATTITSKPQAIKSKPRLMPVPAAAQEEFPLLPGKPITGDNTTQRTLAGVPMIKSYADSLRTEKAPVADVIEKVTLSEQPSTETAEVPAATVVAQASPAVHNQNIIYVPVPVYIPFGITPQSHADIDVINAKNYYQAGEFNKARIHYQLALGKYDAMVKNNGGRASYELAGNIAHAHFGAANASYQLSFSNPQEYWCATSSYLHAANMFEARATFFQSTNDPTYDLSQAAISLIHAGNIHQQHGNDLATSYYERSARISAAINKTVPNLQVSVVSR